MSNNAAPTFRRRGSCNLFKMKTGSMSSTKSVAALIQAVARKYWLRLMHLPVMMEKSQYFSMGWQTHAKPNALSVLLTIEMPTTV